MKELIRKILKETINGGVYYHGSPNYFGIEDIRPNDKGLIFFSKDRNIARRYGTGDFGGETSEHGYNIISAHLDIKNTFDPEEHDNDPKIIELLSNTGNFSHVGRNPNYEELASQALYDGEWAVLETKEFIDGLKELGYDSILIDNRPYYPETRSGERTFHKDIAVFYPHQVIPIH